VSEYSPELESKLRDILESQDIYLSSEAGGTPVEGESFTFVAPGV
jgi:hypothetical protein